MTYKDKIKEKENRQRYYLLNKEKINKYRKEYYILNKKKEQEKNKGTNKNYVLKYPEKANAKQLVYMHRKKNPTLYPKICFICENTNKIEYHHADYTKPLDVLPLCKNCHIQKHIVLRGEC